MSYVVYYHGACAGFTGRAYSPLCILEAAGAKYEMKGLDALPEGSTTFACPMVTLAEGTTIAQTGPICIVLGQALGLAPTALGPAAKAMQITGDVGDMLTDVMAKKGAERVMKWMNHFDALLGDKPYFMGDTVTYVDYTVLGIMTAIPLKQAKGVEDIKGVDMTPKVAAWYTKMKTDPAVQKVDAISAFLPDGYV